LIGQQLTASATAQPETSREDTDWIHLAQDRKKWQALECSGSIKCRKFLD